MSFVVVIPARYASTRLPGKPLALISGKPMIQRVAEQAQKSDAKQVIVATDDRRIADTVTGFGGDACMTRADHMSGTDRLQEVVSQRRLADDEIVVNVQGDEPFIPPAVINQVANNLRARPQAAAATLVEAIVCEDDYTNPNVVKVVSDAQDFALYFSRAPIPHTRQGTALLFNQPSSTSQRHIGIYGYRASLLHQFTQWPPVSIELIESLEQLRLLYYGHKIHLATACKPVPAGIDTPEDLQRARQFSAGQRS